MYLLLLLIVFGLIAFHIITRYGRRGRLTSMIPGLYAYPFVGNMLYFNTDCTHEIWKKLRYISDKYYPVTRIWYISSAVVCIRHPDDVEILLTSQAVIDKSYVYKYVQPWLKTGLLTGTGKKWRQRRKILTPAFHLNILKKYLNVMNEQSEKCVQNLMSEDQEVVQEVTSLCTELTLNTICESAMGVALGSMDSKIVKSYKKAVHDFNYIVTYRAVRPYIPDWMMIPIWKIGRLHCNSLRILNDLTDKVIKERRTYHLSEENKELERLHEATQDQPDIEQKKKLPMLDHLLAAERKGLINEEGIQEEVNTFTFAGHDSTSATLTFTLMLLAENKEIQDRVREEVTEVIVRNEGEFQMSDLVKLTYLERCIEESLRLYPPVATIMRYTREDLQLKHALVPAGSHITVSLYDLHRDSNFWPNPDKFNPDRFLPENSRNRHPFAYAPFSAGPRNCIGQKFAMMELKVSIARILYDFYLEPIDRLTDIKLVMGMVIKPMHPVSIRFVKINN